MIESKLMTNIFQDAIANILISALLLPQVLARSLHKCGMSDHEVFETQRQVADFALED